MNFLKLLIDIEKEYKTELLDNLYGNIDRWELSDKLKMSEIFFSKTHLEDLIVNNVHDEKEFEKWVNFENRISLETSFPTEGFTLGAHPCYSSACMIEDIKYEWGGMNRKLWFKKSFIGNYFTIFGENSCYFTDNSDRYTKYYELTHSCVFSPDHHYQEVFLEVEKMIRSEFKGIKIIPFVTFRHSLKHGNNSIYNLLFDDNLNSYTTYLGDIEYGMTDWK